MLTSIHPSLRTPIVVPITQNQNIKGRSPSAADRSRSLQFNISAEEFVRRDDCVRQMFLDCHFFIGDVCEPAMEQARNEYGKCTIKKIFRSYHDFPTMQAMDWPKDDRPLIVTAETEKKPEGAELILCTPKYLRLLPKNTC